MLKLRKKIFFFLRIAVITGVIFLIYKEKEKISFSAKKVSDASSLDLTIFVYIAIGIFLLILVPTIIFGIKSWRKKRGYGTINPPGTKTAGGGETEKKKMTVGSRITWAVIIILFIIPLVWGVGLVVWTLTYSSMKNTVLSLGELSIPAIFEWKLDDTQSGRVRSNFMETKIIYNDDSRFSFVAYYDYNNGRQKAFFDGNKDPKTGRIEGFWHQDYPNDRGKWYLEPDQYSFSSKEPDKWVGKQYSRNMWIKFILKIKH